MIIEEDQYLEHFGKKGMKWGVRNDRRKTVRNAAIGGAVGVGLSRVVGTNLPVAAAGGIVVAALLNRHGNKKLSEMETK